MLSCAGFDCFVEVLNDNLWVKAVEYQHAAEVPGEHRRSCYIESIAGAQWRLGWSKSDTQDPDHPKTDIVASCEIDGESRAMRSCWKGQEAPLHYFEGARDIHDKMAVLPFVFEKITFVDKDDPRRGEAHERLGSICCKIYRVQLLGKQKITGKEMTVLSEELQKKKVDHITVPGDGRLRYWGQQFNRPKYLDLEGTEAKPYIVMEFKYMSGPLLERWDIKEAAEIPSPSPSPNSAPGSNANRSNAAASQQQSQVRENHLPQTQQHGSQSRPAQKENKPVWTDAAFLSAPAEAREQLLMAELQRYRENNADLRRKNQDLQRKANAGKHIEVIDLTDVLSDDDE